jgi:hypothetical protein
MKYTFLLYGDETRWFNATPEELQEVMAAYEAFSREVTEAGALVAGEPLDATSAATTVRVRDGEPVLSDGPFAETREQLGGFYVLECRDLDEAVRWATKIPAVTEGSVEIRPVPDYDAMGDEQPEDERANA